MVNNNKIFYVIFYVIFILFPNKSYAHGVISTVLKPSPRSAVVEAHYSSGEPMSYAKVTVKFKGVNLPFQSGYTDQNGYFAFIPDKEGEWSIIFEDGMAHRSELSVVVTPEEIIDYRERKNQHNSIYQSSIYLKLIVGLSLIFGIMGLLSLFFSKKRKKKVV